MGPFSPCLSILAYHRVLPKPDILNPEETYAEEFEWHLRTVRRWFKVLRLEEAVSMLRSGTLPLRALCITFDDGYLDNATVALPILRRYEACATFFVATGFLNGGQMWNDSIIEVVRATKRDFLDTGAIGLGRLPLGTVVERRSAIAALISALKYLPLGERHQHVAALANDSGITLHTSGLMMSDIDVRALKASGMEVGAHTVNHPILANLDESSARWEIAEGKRKLEEITQSPVALFAYPNGKPDTDFLPIHVEMVKRLGFLSAVTTTWGVATMETDVHRLPRFTPWDKSPSKFVLRLLQNTFRRIGRRKSSIGRP